MPRIRTVKPEFFRHELLQDLELTYQGKCPMLVFAGLWGHCDKAGRFEWRPKLLKLDILPFMQFDMAETLEILEQAKLIHRYSVDGVEYGCITTFAEHQRIGGKEAQEPEKYPTPTRGKREATGKQRGRNREAPVKQQGLQEGKGREEEGKGKEASSAPALSPAEQVNSNAVAYIPLNDGSEYAVSAEQVSEFEKLYPAVDVAQTLNEIRGWNLSHPERRKTRRGVLSHVTGWLAKEQNRG